MEATTTALPKIRPYERATRGENMTTPPVWLMRQAGRYLPEYLDVRKQYSFLEVCHTPELATEVTLQPLRRFDFDAAILFSDILVPLAPMGADLTFEKGHGPKIRNPLRHEEDFRRIRRVDVREELDTVLQTLTGLRRELPEETSLIGFTGAPFTLATYWIEGGKPDPFAHVKQMMYTRPDLFKRLLTELGEMVTEYLAAQYEAGADAVQVFDTWAGIMPAHEYREFNLPVLRNIFRTLEKRGIPSTYFAKGSGHLLSEMDAVGSRVVSLDWRTPLSHARKCFRPGKVLQGNLDPTVLLADEATIRREVRRVLDEAGTKGGHIFNLGHGILPMTPVESVDILLDEVRRSA